MDSHTVVVVTFLDENVPYRFKVPASPLTLKTFKEYLPRKGNYRYAISFLNKNFENYFTKERSKQTFLYISRDTSDANR